MKPLIPPPTLEGLLQCAEADMEARGWSETRKFLARQNGGMKAQLEKACNPRAKVADRAAIIGVVVYGFDMIDTLPEEVVEEYARELKKC
jgi:hypothetical protein